MPRVPRRSEREKRERDAAGVQPNSYRLSESSAEHLARMSSGKAGGSAKDRASPKIAKIAHHTESPKPAEIEMPEIAEESSDSNVVDYDDHGIYMAIDREDQVEDSSVSTARLVGGNSVSTARLDDDSHTIEQRASRRTSTKPKAEEEAAQDMGENGDAISGVTEPNILMLTEADKKSVLRHNKKVLQEHRDAMEQSKKRSDKLLAAQIKASNEAKMSAERLAKANKEVDAM